ncbi:MAG: LEA type 2 family protein [Bacteroidota bacterium]
MKKIILISFCVAVLFSSCTSILEPTVERVEDVDIVEMTRSKLELNAFMVLKNPNGFELDLDNADMKVYVDDIELAEINQTYETTMPKEGEFKMPININMDLDKLYNDNPLEALSKGLQIMSDKKLNVQFKGTILVGKGPAKISVPIDQEEEVRF